MDYGVVDDDYGCEIGRGAVDTPSPGPGAQLRVISTSVRACLGPYKKRRQIGSVGLGLGARGG